MSSATWRLVIVISAVVASCTALSATPPTTSGNKAVQQPTDTKKLIFEGLDAEKRNDYAVALQRYQQALNLGDSMGALLIGQLLENGDGVPRNDDEAIKYYKYASYHGITLANPKLCYLYRHGNIKRDSYLEFRWCQMAAYQGDADSQMVLAILYLNTLNDIPEIVPDAALGMVWETIAAANGSKAADTASDKLEKELSALDGADAKLLASQWYLVVRQDAEAKAQDQEGLGVFMRTVRGHPDAHQFNAFMKHLSYRDSVDYFKKGWSVQSRQYSLRAAAIDKFIAEAAEEMAFAGQICVERDPDMLLVKRAREALKGHQSASTPPSALMIDALRAHLRDSYPCAPQNQQAPSK